MAERYETVAVPFQLRGNRQVLTSMQLLEMPWLREFVAAFPRCFGYEPHSDCLVFYPEGDAP